ncbi:MAG: hypothetical protein IPM56_15985 [Ignavibacteriales bacterium]|nr:MAG: hypothetical protein IPM56_15985 [Ignavibacteriales bacterium]
MNSKSRYWSYEEIPMKDSIVIEHLLRYDDVDRIKDGIDKYGFEKCVSVWEKTMIPDVRIRKLNYFLAKFIFKVACDDHSVSEYLLLHGKTRAERINEFFNG